MERKQRESALKLDLSVSSYLHWLVVIPRVVQVHGLRKRQLLSEVTKWRANFCGVDSHCVRVTAGPIVPTKTKQRETTLNTCWSNPIWRLRSELGRRDLVVEPIEWGDDLCQPRLLSARTLRQQNVPWQKYSVAENLPSIFFFHLNEFSTNLEIFRFPSQKISG